LRGAYTYLLISDNESHASDAGSNSSGYIDRDVKNQLRSARDILVEARTGGLRGVPPGIELPRSVATGPLDPDLLVLGHA